MFVLCYAVMANPSVHGEVSPFSWSYGTCGLVGKSYSSDQDMLWQPSIEALEVGKAWEQVASLQVLATVGHCAG